MLAFESILFAPCAHAESRRILEISDRTSRSCLDCNMIARDAGQISSDRMCTVICTDCCVHQAKGRKRKAHHRKSKPTPQRLAKRKASGCLVCASRVSHLLYVTCSSYKLLSYMYLMHIARFGRLRPVWFFLKKDGTTRSVGHLAIHNCLCRTTMRPSQCPPGDVLPSEALAARPSRVSKEIVIALEDFAVRLDFQSMLNPLTQPPLPIAFSDAEAARDASTCPSRSIGRIARGIQSVL